MLTIMTDELNRYKYVFFTCKHLFYDDKTKKYICSRSGVSFDDLIRCKRCRQKPFKPYFTNNPLVNLETLDG